jgi:hypothetical protein
MLSFMLLFRSRQALNLHDTFPRDRFDFRDEFVISVEGFDVVASTDASTIHQNVGNGATACGFTEKFLQLRAELVLV